MVDAPVERRRHHRYSIQAASRLGHALSGHDYPCRCLDISAGGALLAAPATMPVRAGHAVCLTGAGTFAEQVASLTGEELAATVIRVDRETLLTDGHITVAVRFASD